MKVSIIIPCYNESENIEELVRQIENVEEKACEVEYIIVNNGSTDDTAIVIDKMQKKASHKNIRFVTVDVNQGYGYGIKQGIKYANGIYIGWIHGDLQIKPCELEKFFDYISGHLGQKLLIKGKRCNRKPIDCFFTAGMGFVSTIKFHKYMYDVMSTPVVFHRDILNENLENEFGIDIEMYYLAKISGYKVVHIPVTVYSRYKGTSSWNTGFKSKIKTSKKMFVAIQKIKNKYKRGSSNV